LVLLLQDVLNDAGALLENANKVIQMIRGDCPAGKICWVNPNAINSALRSLSITYEPFETQKCFCDLEFLKQVSPILDQMFKYLIPAVVGLFVALAGVSWLLMHAASQWARARTEMNMMKRGTRMHGATMA
jgi:hypothetical protein